MVQCPKCEREFKTDNGMLSHHCVKEEMVTITVNGDMRRPGKLKKKMSVGQRNQLTKLFEEFNTANDDVYIEINWGP